MDRWPGGAAHRSVVGSRPLALFRASCPGCWCRRLARNIGADEAAVAAAVVAIARADIAEDDDVEFLVDTLTAEPIRDEAAYGGVRVAMDCRVSRSAVKLKLDINVGAGGSTASSVTHATRRLHRTECAHPFRQAELCECAHRVRPQRKPRGGRRDRRPRRGSCAAPPGPRSAREVERLLNLETGEVWAGFCRRTSRWLTGGSARGGRPRRPPRLAMLPRCVRAARPPVLPAAF